MTTETTADLEATDATRLEEPRSGKFVKGDPRAVELGRKGGSVTKAQSLPEQLRKQIDRRAPEIIDGLLSKAERGDTRAFVAAMSYSYGVPATKLIVQREDDPLTQWLMGMAAIEAVNDLPLLPPPTTE